MFKRNDSIMNKITDRQTVAKYLVIAIFFAIFIGMFFVRWHIRNEFLGYMNAFELTAFILLAIVLRCKKYIFIMFIMVFSFRILGVNPYTFDVIKGGYSTKKIYPSDANEIYLLSFKDKSTATVIKKKDKWECIGGNYGNEYACNIISRSLDKH